MSFIENGRYFIVVGIILITQTMNASPPGFQCIDGQFKLPMHCNQIAGLQDYLNSSSTNAQSQWRDEKNAPIVRDCMRGVRLQNMALKNGSRQWCMTADDQAFKLLMEIGQDENQKYHAWKAIKDNSADVVFNNSQCFGSVCYRSSYPGLYRPLQQQGSAAR